MLTVKFDQTNPNWDENPNYSRLFLKSQEQYMKDMLTSRGYVLLNDVYDAFGFPRTAEGMTMGWVKTSTSYIDFGIHENEDGSFDLHFHANTDVQAAVAS